MTLLVFAGSLRTGSLNKKLARVVADLARAAGAEVTLLDLRDYPVPVYDGDLEDTDGLPATVRALKAHVLAHDAFVVVSPEYNGSTPGPLKNLIDWMSRPASDDDPDVFDGKSAAIMSASPGLFGGVRGLITLRAILANLGVLVLPEQFSLSRAHEAFDDAGQLKDARRRAAADEVVRRLIAVASRLKAG